MTKVTTDRDLVTQAALDYFEGWYDGDVARMDRALLPDLVRTPDGWRIANALWRYQ